jgi:prepilin-type N-terminal cleavage/methylation domain-containing protein
MMKMKKLKKGEHGFTILELMVGIAISGLIAAAVTMAISQTFTGSTRNSNHMVAVRQVQEAGYWVSYYTYAAKNLTITGDSGFPIILRWIDFDANQNHKVVFSLDSSGLKGSYYVNDVLNSTKTGKIPVFGFINPDPTKTYCQVSGGSAFSLPDINDAFVITGGNTSDNGLITRTSGTFSITTTGSATYTTIDSSTFAWNITAAGGTITVTAAGSNTRGGWTSETRAATAAITVDSDKDATLSSARGLIFTVTATVGSGQLVESETRVYKVIPKPVS